MGAPASSGSSRGAVAGIRARWFRSAGSYWRPDLYERYFTRTPLGTLLRERDDGIVHAALDRVLGPDDVVLEVGAGTGHYTIPLARRCARVVAVDASPEMVAYLDARAEREGVGNVETGEGRLPDGLEPAGPFDGVVCLGVLGYVPDLDAALRSLAARVRPGGWALVSLPPRTLEGRVHAAVEVMGRRRVSLRSTADAEAAARRAGLYVERTARAGVTPPGITLLLEARRRDAARADG